MNDHLLARELVALAAQSGQLQRIPQVGVQAADIPRLGDVAVDLTAVDGLDRFAEFGVSGREHAHDARMKFARVAQQFVAVRAWHPLVGHQHRDLAAALAQEELALLDGRGGEHGCQGTDQAVEVFKRHGFVIDEKNFVRTHGSVPFLVNI